MRLTSVPDVPRYPAPPLSDAVLIAMNRMPPPEGHHAPPSAHAVYEHAWPRPPYPPSFEHAPDRRPASTQAPLPPQGYPQLARTPAPPAHPQDPTPPPHAGYRPPMNGAPHESSPHSAPPEYRSRMSFQASEPPGTNESTPPSGPLPSTSQFMPPGPPVPPGTPGPYDQGYYQNPAFGARQRKAARAQQACDQCRSRKAKCDEGRPACSHCKENNLMCVYKEVPPHKQEKSAQLVMDRILELEDKMTEKFESFNKIWKTQESAYKEIMAQRQEMVTQRQMIADLLSARSADSSRLPGSHAIAALPAAAAITVPITASQQETLMKTESAPTDLSEEQPASTSFYSQGSLEAGHPSLLSSSFEDTAKNDNEGELSIPVEHTTAAHKLLMWPSIKRLLNADYDEDYVMRLEEERGLISVYGQGEISYTADDTLLPTPPFPNDDGGFDEKYSNSDGTSKILSATSPSDADADIDRFGWLRLDGKTAYRYFQSYMNRMHILHPFLWQHQLEAKVDAFIRCYCSRTSSPMSEPNTLCRDKKRKRSHEDLQGIRGTSADSTSASNRPRVGRNIDNAIILLVLALGAICERKSPLPGPIMDNKVEDYRQQFIPPPLGPLPPRPPSLPQQANGTAHAPNGVLSPANSDSVLPLSSYYAPHFQHTQTFSSEPDPNPNLSRQTISATHDEYGNVKNLQVIPGLALYGYATKILGLLQGGVELSHVQAGLLAGLYAGQLAHPFQSHGWICQAARACQVLVRQKRYERLPEGQTQDMFNFAYWTCLQLESDLLAELDIPASGISRSEGRINLPKGRFTIDIPDDLEAPSTRMMLFYSAQIHLRKVLNRVHTDLYKVDKQGETGRWSASPPRDNELERPRPPAREINAARMRAKYYGARYIIHRPLLYHALHYGQTGARIGSIPQTAPVDSPTGSTSASQTQQMSPSITHASNRASSAHMQRMLSDVGAAPSSLSSSFANSWTPPTVILRELPSKLRRACKVCIESAILSTEAFDGVEDRLVVTNIFGTAHAQFGNMLVLSATYNSSLSELVERPTLQRLLKRTIRFLLRSQNISPTLRADARILTEIYTKIFHHAPNLNEAP
ncbi:uncharacterized protein N7482_010300 [Penicillium canariense]|uniref:Zn(2)-C6 fungal-type domain-containing protein n=1 Tax=Penicillium canariense TaxID=189055 RepID=A0A9W9HLP9_9EURO|nr:uncharacterized protein N7482_010300 [Penicillium canariense]KAJ5151048.1 hypothetical protein N7482_010300 [Penicillium canariense]